MPLAHLFDRDEYAESYHAWRAQADGKDRCLHLCVGCPSQGRSTVWGCGDPDSPVVLVGESPGPVEVNQGRPFVGRSGRLLNKALWKMGLIRTRIWLTNTVKCYKKPGKSLPKKVCEHCYQYLREELMGREVVIAVGSVANEILTSHANGDRILLGLTHPAAVLREKTGLRIYTKFWKEVDAIAGRLAKWRKVGMQSRKRSETPTTSTPTSSRSSERVT